MEIMIQCEVRGIDGFNKSNIVNKAGHVNGSLKTIQRSTAEDSGFACFACNAIGVSIVQYQAVFCLSCEQFTWEL